jgi:predicted RNase H-like nuclease (RuvC/YqgF family)
METGFRTVAPPPAPAVVPAPAESNYAPGIARPRPVSRQTRATRKNKNATSSALTRSIKARKIRETLDKDIKELEAKEDKMKKATEAAARHLIQTSREATKKALKTTKLFKKKKAEIERRITQKKARRSNLLQRKITARRQTSLTAMREARMNPPDVKMGMGRR